MTNSAFTTGGSGSSGTLESVGLTSNTLVVTDSPVTGAGGTMEAELPESVCGNNMALNGNFQLMQRATLSGGILQMTIPASTNGAYTFDRFQIVTNANQQYQVVQYTEVSRPSGSFQAQLLRVMGQTGTGVVKFVQSFPRNFCRGAAGRQVTFSCQMAHGPDFSPTLGDVTISIFSGTGTTDSSVLSGWTGQTTESAQVVQVGTGFTTFIVTTGVLGSTVSQLAVQLSFAPTGTAGTDDSLSITNFKIELGANATPFDRNNITDMLNQCQAFACKSYDITVAPGTISSNGYKYFAWAATTSQKAIPIDFPTTMQSVPTVTLYSPSAGTSGMIDSAGSPVTGFVVGAGMSGFVMGTNDAGSAASIAGHYFADAELY